jgi:integrase/recombinase XerC
VIEAGPAGGTVDTAELLADYRRELERSPLAANTRTAYGRQVRRYLGWLDDRAEGVDAALSDPLGRDFAVRDYRSYLRDAHLSAASINAALAGLDHLYRFLELGPPIVRREQLAALAPRALSEAELRSVFRAAERRGNARDRAALALMALAGLRIAEVAGLDVDDVALSARKGHVVVRHGKGDTSRTVPLGALARELVEDWKQERPAVSSPALFITAGHRLSIRSLDRAVRLTGDLAGVPLSAHVLRHTFVTRLVRSGVDVVTVAELAGHRTLETTRRYSLPSEADRQAAVENAALEL